MIRQEIPDDERTAVAAEMIEWSLNTGAYGRISETEVVVGFIDTALEMLGESPAEEKAGPPRAKGWLTVPTLRASRLSSLPEVPASAGAPSTWPRTARALYRRYWSKHADSIQKLRDRLKTFEDQPTVNRDAVAATRAQIRLLESATHTRSSVIAYLESFSDVAPFVVFYGDVEAELAVAEKTNGAAETRAQKLGFFRKRVEALLEGEITSADRAWIQAILAQLDRADAHFEAAEYAAAQRVIDSIWSGRPIDE